MAVVEFLGYATNGDPVGYGPEGVTNRFTPCPSCEYAYHHPTLAAEAASCACQPRKRRRIWPLVVVAVRGYLPVIVGVGRLS